MTVPVLTARTVYTAVNRGTGSWIRLGVLALAVAALYAPVVRPMIQEWVDFPSLSHGFAIPLIAGYFIWSKRERLLAIRPASSVLGLPLLLLGLLALLTGTYGNEPFLARLSLLFTLYGIVLVAGGFPLFKHVWYGIGYLAFMIPLPYATLKLVTYRSRLFDAAVSGQLLQWLGVPILQDGVWLYLPDITLEVADECSSIPALAAMTALGAAYASITRTGGVIHRGFLVLATIPLAITSNIIRIVSTAWGVYYIGPVVLKSALHQFNGTTNFLLTFLLLMLLDTVLSRLGRRKRT